MPDGNVSFAKLGKTSEDDGLEDGFSTPKWMANISLSNEHLIKNFGAGNILNHYYTSFLGGPQIGGFYHTD